MTQTLVCAHARRGGRAVHIARAAQAHSVMLSRHADVQAVLRDARFGRPGFREAAANAIGEGPLLESYSQWFLFQDPPDHTRLRGLVSKAFTPRAVENLRHKIDDVVEHLLDQ